MQYINDNVVVEGDIKQEGVNKVVDESYYEFITVDDYVALTSVVTDKIYFVTEL